MTVVIMTDEKTVKQIADMGQPRNLALANVRYGESWVTINSSKTSRPLLARQSAEHV